MAEESWRRRVCTLSWTRRWGAARHEAATPGDPPAQGLPSAAAGPAGRRPCAPCPDALGAPAGWGKTTLLADWMAAESDRRPFAWLALDGTTTIRCGSGRTWSRRSGRWSPEVGAASRLPAPGRTTGSPRSSRRCSTSSAHPRRRSSSSLDDYHLVGHPRDPRRRWRSCSTTCPPSLHLVLATRVRPAAAARAPARRAASCRDPRARAALHGEEPARSCSDCPRARSRRRGVARLRGPHRGLDRRPAPRGAVHRGAPTRPRSSPRSPGTTATSSTTSARRCSPSLPDGACALPPADVDPRAALRRRSAMRSRDNESSARLIARAVERSNLFLVPLDATRTWYRYHHLFARAAAPRARQTDPELVPTLHRRAGAWLTRSRRRLTRPSITRRLAGDGGVAADLIALTGRRSSSAASSSLSRAGWTRSPSRWSRTIPVSA